jgi:hypothetical protein
MRTPVLPARLGESVFVLKRHEKIEWTMIAIEAGGRVAACRGEDCGLEFLNCRNRRQEILFFFCGVAGEEEVRISCRRFLQLKTWRSFKTGFKSRVVEMATPPDAIVKILPSIPTGELWS